jgi:hypothetical protein
VAAQVRHQGIGHDRVNLYRERGFDRFQPVPRRDHFVTGAAQDDFQVTTHRRVVFHEQDGGLAGGNWRDSGGRNRGIEDCLRHAHWKDSKFDRRLERLRRGEAAASDIFNGKSCARVVAAT